MSPVTTRLRRPSASSLLLVLVLACVVAAAWGVARGWALSGRSPVHSAGEAQVLGVFFLAIVVGELNRIAFPGRRPSAPMSVAAAYGLVMTTSVLDSDVRFGSGVALITVAGAFVLGGVLQLGRASAPTAAEVAARFLGVLVACLGFRSLLLAENEPLAELRREWGVQPWLLALVMVAVSGLALASESLVTAWVTHIDERVPWAGAIRDELSQVAGLSTALVASGALIALAERALGVWAVPVYLIPLVLTQFALRRYAGIRETYGQTIRTLSRLTEVGGYTSPGHPARVAELSVAMGRMLGVPTEGVAPLQYSALLHDIGQMALRNPIPGGATMMAAPADQDRIAQDGADIVRTTGVLDDVASILEVQAKPYRHVRELGESIPLPARIIKVANAYDDLVGDKPTAASRAEAVERIHLGLGYEYDPAVVEALERVLAMRDDRTGVGSAPHDRRG